MILYNHRNWNYKNKSDILYSVGIYSANPDSSSIRSKTEYYFEKSYPNGYPYITFVCSRCGNLIYAESIVEEFFCTCYNKMTKRKNPIYLIQIPYNKEHIWKNTPLHLMVSGRM
jgi:hypothetical protein